MKTTSITIAIAAALIGAGTMVSVQSNAQHDMHPQTDASPSMQMHKAMMMMGNMKVSGDVDRDFAMLMADHHLGAIKMVDIYLKNGKNAQLKAMAKKMKVDQTKERAILLKHAQMKH